eukprot:scaffold2527_cov337-Prasinococcus_capsulatus_cf.AAC.11
MAAEDAQSAAELRASLAEYQEQLQGVKSALQVSTGRQSSLARRLVLCSFMLYKSGRHAVVQPPANPRSGLEGYLVMQ